MFPARFLFVLPRGRKPLKDTAAWFGLSSKKVKHFVLHEFSFFSFFFGNMCKWHAIQIAWVPIPHVF